MPSAPVLGMVCCPSKLRKKSYLGDPGLMERYVRINSFDIKLLSNILTLLLRLGLNRTNLINIIFIFIIFNIVIIIFIIVIIITIIMITLVALLVYISHQMPRFEIFQNSLYKKQKWPYDHVVHGHVAYATKQLLKIIMESAAMFTTSEYIFPVIT